MVVNVQEDRKLDGFAVSMFSRRESERIDFKIAVLANYELKKICA
jgi:hypothetical protein